MKEVKINIPSSTEFVGPVVKFLYDFFSNKGIQETVASNVVTSVIEAVGNAIVHGNNNDSSKKIDILIQINKNTLNIEVQDEGEGFDVSSVPDPTDPKNFLKPSGRGILFMNIGMDGVCYNEKGNILTLIKYRVSPH